MTKISALYLCLSAAIIMVGFSVHASGADREVGVSLFTVTTE